MPDTTADWFTPRIAARTALARALREKPAAWLLEHSLKPADLEILIAQGEAAQVADREQHGG